MEKAEEAEEAGGEWGWESLGSPLITCCGWRSRAPLLRCSSPQTRAACSWTRTSTATSTARAAPSTS